MPSLPARCGATTNGGDGGPCILPPGHDESLHEDRNGSCWLVDVTPESTPRTALRERLDAALRTVGLARNLAAYRDAVLPVVEEALAEHMDERGAEQIERIQAERHALPKDERVRLDAADAPMLRIQLAVMARKVAETKAELERTSTAAALEIWHKLGLNAVLTWKERAEQAETERAALADRNRDLDTQLTRERQARLAAEAAVRRIRAFLEDMRTWCSPYGVAADYANRALEALDADQPKETP